MAGSSGGGGRGGNSRRVQSAITHSRGSGGELEAQSAGQEVGGEQRGMGTVEDVCAVEGLMEQHQLEQPRQRTPRGCLRGAGAAAGDTKGGGQFDFSTMPEDELGLRGGGGEEWGGSGEEGGGDRGGGQQMVEQQQLLQGAQGSAW